MKYLQKGPFSVGGGLSNYDEVFGRKCFFCRKPLNPENKEEWDENAHKSCMESNSERT